MPSSILRPMLIGPAFALSAFAAMAQVAASASAPASRPSTAIAVQPNAAAAATKKAVPRSDVATVVKTGPTAADKAEELADRAKPGTDKRARHPGRAASAASAAARH